MSASQQKKRRRQDAGKSAAGQPERKSGRGAWIAGGVFVAAIVLAALFFGLTGSGLFQHITTAATVGSHDVSPALYNFFYGETAQQDPTASPEGLRILTAQKMAETYAVYDEAVQNGFTLTEGQRAALDADIDNIDSYAEYTGAANGSAYLRAVYGTGCDKERYREYMEVMRTVQLYTEAHRSATTFSDEEIEAYYEAHRDEIDTVSYRSFTCTDKETADLFLEEAEGSETAFAEQAREQAGEGESETYEDNDATLTSDQTVDALPEALRDWLTDPARESGEITAVENEDGTWTVCQFVDNWTKYETASTIDVRHILIRTDDSTSAEQAKAKADELLAQYQDGEQTEAAFGELAKANSADGNAAQGGLYEGVSEGQMVDTFNDWCFDPERQPGDTGVVETQYGAHVMYFVGEGRSRLQKDALEGLRTAESEEWAKELGAALSVEESSFGMGFTSAE